MSSRHEYRRHDRGWDRDERGRDRDRERHDSYRDVPQRSRSRSPPRRGGERGRRGSGRRDYGRDREEDRRDRDRRNDQRRDDKDRRDYGHDRNGRREPAPKDRERERGVERVTDAKPSERPRERDGRLDDKRIVAEPESQPGGSRSAAGAEDSNIHSRHESEVPMEEGEEDEAMDAINEDDAVVMTMMGLSGFGTTKGKHVEGNQEGAVDIKKMRTWRQYMNRRGGFNRPLDKIK